MPKYIGLINYTQQGIENVKSLAREFGDGPPASEVRAEDSSQPHGRVR